AAAARHHHDPVDPTLLGDVLDGLAARPRRISSKYFYDARGSALFEAITRQPEYFLTRVELELLATHMPAIAAAVGPDVHVVEYGSGSGLTTGRLLAGLQDPLAYTPVEISPAALEGCVARLRPRFPRVALRAISERGGRGRLRMHLLTVRSVCELAASVAAGVIPEFSFNLLARLCRELDAHFYLPAFAHQARYVPPCERTETRIVSLRS